jgi:predicted type IV restriction endonuclease
MTEYLFQSVKQIKIDNRINSFDEAATKQVVVSKILHCLGWDPFNINEVCPEYEVGNVRVDFALRHNDTNKVFIEVRKVVENLGKGEEQLLKISFRHGVDIAILTNGISWRFYLPLLKGSCEERRFYTIQILEQSADDITQKFADLLSKINVISGRALENAKNLYKSKQRSVLMVKTLPKAWNKVISEPEKLLLELVAETTEKLCGYKPDDEMVRKYITSTIKLDANARI